METSSSRTSPLSDWLCLPFLAITHTQFELKAWNLAERISDLGGKTKKNCYFQKPCCQSQMPENCNEGEFSICQKSFRPSYTIVFSWVFVMLSVFITFIFSSFIFLCSAYNKIINYLVQSTSGKLVHCNYD